MPAKIKDFIFEPFKLDGLSGTKLLATRKKDGRRFVVKEESAVGTMPINNGGDVRNEFVYHSLIKELGLPSLEVFLFEKFSKGKSGLDGYAVGIEYIDAKPLTKQEIQQNPNINMAHLVGFHALSHALSDFDNRIEILITKHNRIYRIDAAESLHYDTSLRRIKMGYEHVIENFGQEHSHHYINTIKAVADLPFAKIESILDRLVEVFPTEIKDEYVDFFNKCQSACREFAKTV